MKAPTFTGVLLIALMVTSGADLEPSPAGGACVSTCQSAAEAGCAKARAAVAAVNPAIDRKWNTHVAARCREKRLMFDIDR